MVAPSFTRFDEQYELTPKVLRGRSEFFEIKQCRDKATEDFKGVKIYRKAELSEDCITMIKKEIELTRKIDHPNLCRVYNVIEDEKKIYIIIDDLRGRSLFDHIIQKNTLGENETAVIAQQIVSCMKYLHKHKIILRRIKLDTVLFADSETITDLRLVDLMFFTDLGSLESENPYLIDEIFMPPDSLFQGALKFIPAFNHQMSAPELLPPFEFLKNPHLR